MSSIPETLVQFRSELEEAIGREHGAARLRNRGRRRRRVVAFAAVVLVAVGTASALGTVRDLLFGSARGTTLGTPIWSPDGRRIAYAVGTCASWGCGNSAEWYVMNADGTGEERDLTHEWGRDINPVWSPDWRRVAYVVNPCSGVTRACTATTAIYGMDLNGTGVRKLARGVRYHQNRVGQRDSQYGAIPAWSHDGRKIAFVSDRSGSAEVYVMNADGSGQRRLTRHAEPEELAWSPDGRMLAFDSRARGGPREVYVMNADGTGLLNLTAGPGGGEALSWSPDSRKIGFRSLRDGSGEIYTVNVDGSGLRRLTRLTRSPVSSGWTTFSTPSWSPDGRQILFERVGWGDGLANSEIVVMNADGSRQRNLTRNPAWDGASAWSPDGRKIAFVSKRDGYGEIYVMNADGSGQRDLTQIRKG